MVRSCDLAKRGIPKKGIVMDQISRSHGWMGLDRLDRGVGRLDKGVMEITKKGIFDRLHNISKKERA